MKRLRQIVTKAVVAKGKKRFESTETLCPPNAPTNILGCWVINHQYQSKRVGDYVEIAGKFDVNVWYAYQNQSKTAVYTQSVQYKDKIKLHFRDGEKSDSNAVKVKVLQQPNCVEAVIAPNRNEILVTVEREFLVEVVGETTICITVHPLDEEEDWELRESSSSSSSSSFRFEGRGNRGESSSSSSSSSSSRRDESSSY